MINNSEPTAGDYKLYNLFCVSELGREFLEGSMKDTFMDQPIDFTGESFAFFDGRRSLIRDIWSSVEKVKNHLIKDRIE